MSRFVFPSVRLLSACAFIAALPAPFAMGDDAPAPAEPKPAAKPETKEAPPLLVTATRLPETRESLGSPVTAFDGADLERGQIRSFADALRDAPGVYVQRSGGLGALTELRLRGTSTGQTLLRMDGVRVMDPSASNGGAALDHLLANDFGRVEVLPGPHSTLYGSDAIGGVVSAETAKGQGPVSGFASVEAGSRQTFIERVGGGGGDDTFNWHVGAVRHDTRGFSTTYPDTEKDRYGNTSGAVRLGWNITDIFGVDLVARVASAKVAYDDVFDLSTFANQTFDVYRPRNTTDLGYLKVAPRLLLADGKWEQTLSLSVFGIRREDTGINDPFIPSYPRKFAGRNLELDWQNTIHASQTLDFVGGVNLLRQDAKASGASANFKADAETSSAYGEVRWRPTEEIALGAGGRADHHSQFGTQETWRVHAAWSPAATNSTLRGSVGTAFKAPTLAQLYDATPYFGSPLNDPDLKPERSLGWDAGADQRFFGEGDKAALTLSGTFFQNRIRNQIGSDPVTFAYANTNRVVTQGVEASASWKALQGADGVLSIRGAYTYTDARNDITGTRLANNPLHTASLRADYTLPRDAASFGAVGRFASSRDQYDPYLPPFGGMRSASGYFTVDLVARVKIASQVSAFGRIENLFDNNKPELLGYNPTPFGAFAGVEVKF